MKWRNHIESIYAINSTYQCSIPQDAAIVRELNVGSHCSFERNSFVLFKDKQLDRQFKLLCLNAFQVITAPSKFELLQTFKLIISTMVVQSTDEITSCQNSHSTLHTSFLSFDDKLRQNPKPRQV